MREHNRRQWNAEQKAPLGYQQTGNGVAPAPSQANVGKNRIRVRKVSEDLEDAAFDTFARLKPGLAAYARIAYARELRGDLAGSAAAMVDTAHRFRQQ